MAKPLLFTHQDVAEEFNIQSLGDAILAYCRAVEGIFAVMGHGLWSGQARGHLLAFTNALKNSRTTADIKAQAAQLATKYSHFTEHSTEKKNYQTGGSSAVIIGAGRGYSLQFSTKIPYFDQNESTANPKYPSTPWNSTETGFKAIREYMASTRANERAKAMLRKALGTGQVDLRKEI